MPILLNTGPGAATAGAALSVAHSGPPPSAAATPEEYLGWVLDVLQAIALNQSRMDWPAVRADAFASIESATGTADTYPAIQLAIAALGDPHTLFITPDELDR